MKKEELLDGKPRLAMLRDGDVGMIIGGFWVGNKYQMNLHKHDEHLIYTDICEGELDIMRVSKVLIERYLLPKYWTEETLNNNLLWERESVEYVECIKVSTFNEDLTAGRVYLVIENDGSGFGIYDDVNDLNYLDKDQCKPSTKEAYEAQFKVNELTIAEVEKRLGIKNVKIVK